MFVSHLTFSDISMWNCVSPFKPPAECVFLSKCSPSLRHLPSDSSLSIWVLFWHRQLLSHFKKPRTHKQGLDWECMFLWWQHCIFTVVSYLFYSACVCLNWGIGRVHDCSAECCDWVRSLDGQRLCLNSEVKDSPVAAGCNTYGAVYFSRTFKLWMFDFYSEHSYIISNLLLAVVQQYSPPTSLMTINV